MRHVRLRSQRPVKRRVIWFDERDKIVSSLDPLLCLWKIYIFTTELTIYIHICITFIYAWNGNDSEGENVENKKEGSQRQM